MESLVCMCDVSVPSVLCESPPISTFKIWSDAPKLGLKR